jgi:hypothetical protein
MSRGALLTAACLFAAACGADKAAHDEVVGELRALRLALGRSTVADPDRAALQAAVASVAATQKQLAERQAAVQQELATWSQRIAAEGHGQRADEAKALAARVAELESELQKQAARQIELETVLKQTLDRAAERIDAILEPAAGKPAGAEPARPIGGGALDLRLLWGAVAACGVVVASFLLRGRPWTGSPSEMVAQADEGVPTACIAPFTALADAGGSLRDGETASAVDGGLPAGEERVAVAAERLPAALAALAREPMVLRRPAPVADAAVAGAEVRFWLAPTCSPAERARLRRRIQSAG